MYGCPSVGLPDFASLQWMSRTHSGGSPTSSAAQTAETYLRRVHLARPILTRDATNSDNMSVSDDCSALGKATKVDNGDRYLVWVLGAHPRTPTVATLSEPAAAITVAQQAAAARNDGLVEWESTSA